MEERISVFGVDTTLPNYLSIIKERYEEVQNLEDNYRGHLAELEDGESFVGILKMLYESKADLIYFLGVYRDACIKEMLRIKEGKFESVDVSKLKELSRKAESGTISVEEVTREEMKVKTLQKKIFDSGKYPLTIGQTPGEALEAVSTVKLVLERLIWSIDSSNLKNELREIRGEDIIASLMKGNGNV